MVTTLRRGRAASYVRPGLVIKDILLGKIPIEDQHTGVIHPVTEACPTDIHREYKRLVREHNSLTGIKVHPSHYTSFITMFRFAHELGLVELVRKEDMISPPPTGNLYTVARHDGAHVEISKRNVYRLTETGKQDELSWTNLCRAYIEHWIAPQKAPEVAIAAVPTRYKFSEIPSKEQLTMLMEHLKSMVKINENELDDLVDKMDAWLDYYEKRLGIAKDREKYEQLSELTSELMKNINQRELKTAVETLNKMIARA